MRSRDPLRSETWSSWAVVSIHLARGQEELIQCNTPAKLVNYLTPVSKYTGGLLELTILFELGSKLFLQRSVLCASIQPSRNFPGRSMTPLVVGYELATLDHDFDGSKELLLAEELKFIHEEIKS